MPTPDDEFLEWNRLGVLSRDAFELHAFALVNSVADGHPGFVSDEYLNAIPAETTLAAAELEAAGLWSRREGGYFIVEDATLKEVLRFNEEAGLAEAECEERGAHSPSPDEGGWVICEHCGAPLKRTDGGAVALPDGRPSPHRSRPQDPPVAGL